MKCGCRHGILSLKKNDKTWVISMGLPELQIFILGLNQSWFGVLSGFAKCFKRAHGRRDSQGGQGCLHRFGMDTCPLIWVQEGQDKCVIHDNIDNALEEENKSLIMKDIWVDTKLAQVLVQADQ